jgi:hypothetical protein
LFFWDFHSCIHEDFRSFVGRGNRKSSLRAALAAKQPVLAARRKMDCFAALAMTGFDYRPQKIRFRFDRRK